ncbi:hypothetical protein AYO21_07197 [Fonsecaea monophora]|nr:hypothetical protein AYO21_07197 [Fonsecaea monophora]OAG38537.1 hypothetical protein AYO21_07197 [Fonsecaea monophora]
MSKSPAKSCDIVMANAGVSGLDDVFDLDDPSGPPVKPNLRIVNINLIGVLYTVKLAMHYFRKSPVDEHRDRCLILQGSTAAYVDQPGTPQYSASKFGVRGLMRSLRRTSWMQDVRVNFLCPWFTKTPIMSEEVIQRLEKLNLDFATLEDAGRAALRIASDKTMNGRAIVILPRKFAPEGFIDVARDDLKAPDPRAIWQSETLRVSHRVAEAEGHKKAAG